MEMPEGAPVAGVRWARLVGVWGVWLPGGQWAGHDGGFEPISGTCADPTRDLTFITYEGSAIL